MTDIKALIERLEAADGPDQKLNRDLTRITHKRTKRFIGATCNCCPGGRHLDKVWVDRETNKWRTTAKYGLDLTASLDAAVAFAERVLPGCWYQIAKGKLRDTEPLFGALILFGSDEVLGAGEHPTSLPIALLIATLRAMEGGR